MGLLILLKDDFFCCLLFTTKYFFLFYFYGERGKCKKKMYCTPFEFSSVRLGGSMLEKITMRAGGGRRPSLRDLQALACRDGSGSLSFVHILAPPLYSSLAGRGKSRGPWVAHLQAPQKTSLACKGVIRPQVCKQTAKPEYTDVCLRPKQKFS